MKKSTEQLVQEIQDEVRLIGEKHQLDGTLLDEFVTSHTLRTIYEVVINRLEEQGVDVWGLFSEKSTKTLKKKA